MMRAISIITSIACLLQLGAASSPKHIQFPDTRLYRYEGGLTNRGVVHAFGDFDSDRYTDAILVDANNTVRVFLWSITELKFEEVAWAAVAKNVSVVSVIASDFDRDGKLDLLICTRVSTSLQQMSVHLQRDRSMLEVKLDGFTTGHVQLLDVDSNLHVDLVGNALGAAGDSVPSVWLNCFDSPSCSFRLQADTTLGSNFTLSAGMGFVDLDGDCLADRFAAVQRNGVENFEVWINRNRGEWSQYLSFLAPLGSGVPSFADVDKDGTMDILIPVCYPAHSCSTANSIHIIYNRQIPLCASSLEIGSQSKCRAHSNMCLGDPNFRLGDINGASSDTHVVVDRSAFAGLTFAPGEADLQLTVRAGDINMDGYPDLLVPLQRVGDDGITRYMTMWLNVPCDSARCTAQAVAAGRRTYQCVQDIDPTYSVLSSIEHAYSGGFFDFNEQGAVGLMINSNATGANSVLTLFNNLEADSLFLKAIGMNGVCPAWCPSGEKFPSPKPYGVNQPGVSFKFTVSDLDGTQRARVGAQLPVSGPQSLLAPYSHHGLGRTNDYLQYFFAGFPSGAARHWQSWPGIIPNSQLIVFPYEPASPADWTLELLVSPARSLPQVAAAIVVTMVVLALTALYFHWQEQKHDAAEKQKRAEFLVAF